jgi:hypothetical protein
MLILKAAFVFLSTHKKVGINIYKTIIFPAVCVCETWSLTLKEEQVLKVFENRVLKKIA